MDKNIYKKILLYWLPLMIWMGVIYWFSGRPSLHTSKIYWQDFIIKKSAHFTEYFILSLLIYRALLINNLSHKRSRIYAIFFAAIYAISDEIHQRYTLGRESTIRDATIDTIGAIFAMLIVAKILPQFPEKINVYIKKLGLI